MRDVAVRVCQLPARESIRGKTLVHQTERAGDIRVRELAVKIRDLRCEQKPLVDDGSTGKRRDVEELFVFYLGFRDLAFRTFTNDIKLALERVLIHFGRTPDKNLLNVRL